MAENPNSATSVPSLASRGPSKQSAIHGLPAINASQRLRQQRKIRPPHLSGKVRFRVAIRKVLNNISWMSEEEPVTEDYKDSDERIIRIATSKKRDSRTFLSLKDKFVLFKPMMYRSAEETSALCKLLGDLPCFRKYPEKERLGLVSCTQFIFYGPNRVIIEEGNKVTDFSAMYFVMSGMLNVIQKIYDGMTEKMVPTVVGTIGQGGTFGEASLLLGEPRMATIITQTPCELLCLAKEDFDNVLRHSLQVLWDEILASMRKFPYFKTWPKKEIRQCCVLSEIKRFPTNATIFGDGEGNENMVYFIVKGACDVICHIVVEKYTAYGKEVFKLRASQHPTTVTSNVETIFLQTSILSAGACFNLGEDFSNRRLVSRVPTDCMCIPRYLLTAPSRPTIIWQQIRNLLESRAPSKRQLLDMFQKKRNWVVYRRSLYRPMPDADTTLSEVPYEWRINALNLDQHLHGVKLNEYKEKPQAGVIEEKPEAAYDLQGHSTGSI